MCQLKRCFASCALVLLLSSVFLVSCFANTAVSDYELALYWSPATFPSHEASSPVYVTSSGETSIISFTSTNGFSGMPLYCSSNYYAPKDYDRTVFCSIGVTVNSPHEAWFNNVNEYKDKGPVTYVDSRDAGGDGSSQLHTLENGVGNADVIYPIMATWGESFAVQITVPAYSVAMEFDTSDFVTFSCSKYGTSDMVYTLTSWGAFVIDTADQQVLEVIQQILANTENIDANITTLIGAINEILAELRSLNADTDTIITLLNGLTDLSDRQLTQLELISGSVDAIYYFLTQELKDESEQLSGEAGAVAGQIQNNDAAEEYYQTSMQGSYDSLNLDGFTFGGVTGALELVGQIFSDVWGALGSWSILYTYPLVLGIALLAIGRLAKTGGGNSSRNTEHKGGEGGA